MQAPTRLRWAALAWLAALTAALTIAGTVTASAALAGEPHGGAGALFVQTNDISGNAILAYARSAAGALIPAGRYATLGRGGTEPGAPTDPLSSQGSLTVDRRHRLLYAVNAGSDSGYRSDHGRLTPIAGSVRSLGLGNARRRSSSARCLRSASPRTPRACLSPTRRTAAEHVRLRLRLRRLRGRRTLPLARPAHPRRPTDGHIGDRPIGLAMVFSLWMAGATGAQAVQRGTVLILIGIPVYVITRSTNPSRRSGAPR
jgi:hypothetical protein